LAERFGGRFVDRATFAAMVEHVSSLLEPFEKEHRFHSRIGGGTTHMLGTSGTVTTLAGVDGCWLEIGDVRAVTANLLDASYEQRVAQPCIGKERADLVLAGCAIL